MTVPLPTAAQKLAVGQDTDRSGPEASTLDGVDQLVPLKVTTLPDPSTAAQKVAVGHDTDSRDLEGSILHGVDQLVPSKVRTLPELSTAAQKVVVGHETESRGLVSMVAGCDHPCCADDAVENDNAASVHAAAIETIGRHATATCHHDARWSEPWRVKRPGDLRPPSITTHSF